MLQPLPRAFDPWGLVTGLDQGATRLGDAHAYLYQVEGQRLKRLSAAVSALLGPLEVTLQGVPVVGPQRGPRRMLLRVAVRGKVELVCQRCLRVFARPLDAEFEAEVSAESLPAKAPQAPIESMEELVCAPGEHVDIVTLVEDEALLGLPFAPRCGRPECETRDDLAGDRPSSEDKARAVGDNPFAALKDLLSKNSDSNQE